MNADTHRWWRRLALAPAVVVAVAVPGFDGAGAASGYGPPALSCGFADPRLSESSGVASSSWAENVIWTHNDSGDGPRFFAVATTVLLEERNGGGDRARSDPCETLAVYEVTGAQAIDWEDMARAGRTLYFGDIGDNGARRSEIAVYEVAEPATGTPSGPVPLVATHVLRYPDGPHDAEALLVDPTTGLLVVVTKSATGLGAAYRAPAAGDGTMEKVADLDAGAAGGAERLTTGADASDRRLIVRTYTGAFEWDVNPGEDLAVALARPAAAVALPFTFQGEAIAYTADGSGLWTTSESRGGRVHLLGPAVAESPPPPPGPAPVPADPIGEGGGSSGWWLAAAGTAVLVLAVAVVAVRKGPARRK